MGLREYPWIKQDGIEFCRHRAGKRILVEWPPDAPHRERSCSRASAGQEHSHLPQRPRFSLAPIGFESAWGKVMRMLVERSVLEKPLRLLDPRAKAYADHDHAL